jgi:hypothetical protein
MQKVMVYCHEEPADWDGHILTLGRVPCVGELINPAIPNVKTHEVVSVTHRVDLDTGTVAAVMLKRK